MPEINTVYVTISCDANGCDKTVTFLNTEDKQDVKKAFHENPWLNSIRTIHTVDQRKFLYCSDKCAIEATATGIHNQKTIVTPTEPNAVGLAAQAAERARQATEALKSGEGKVVLG